MAEIKSSLLNSKDMQYVKNSILNVSDIDGEDNFRVRLVEYINDSSANNDDKFFYDMLPYMRFLKPGDKSVAYTTPDKLIWVNAPDDKVGKNYRQWDAIYDHECLHQLWDTFGVENKIKEANIKFDHYVLNVASDCVINDYLQFYRRKELPDFVITPKNLKEQFDITYDRKNDTQYTLYLKLLEKAEELRKDKRCQNAQDGESQSGEGGEGNSQGSNGGNSSSNSQKGNSNESADEAAERAEKAAKRAEEAANKAAEEAKDASPENAEEANKKADEAKKAAEEAKKAADEAKKAADEGNTKEARDAADRAEQAANKAEGKSGKENGGGKGQGHDGTGDNTQLDYKDDHTTDAARAIIEKYRRKISGVFGEFIAKCTASVELRESGLSAQTSRAQASWNQQMTSYVNAYVKKRVFQKKRMHMDTYRRVKRGVSSVEYGQPIPKGRMIKDDKLNIDVAFYIDRSGSMSGSIDHVFEATYKMGEALKKQFRRETVVDEIKFKLFAFDTQIMELNWGKRCNVGGGTMDFDELMTHINSRTQNYMINIIITDAEFGVDQSKVTDMLEKLGGILLFITNNDNADAKMVAKKNQLKMAYILADANFTIK